MKMLLILWAIALVGCDKLDRTYLPPSRSDTAGGFPEDLRLPLEFSKVQTSTLKPGSLTANSSLSSKYPNVALGIDRQGPSVAASPKFFTNQPEILVSKNIYNIPTTTTSYDLIRTSTSLPAKTYATTIGPVTTVSQKYPSIPSGSDPNLSYDQYVQQTIKPNKSQYSFSNSVSREPVTNFPNKIIASLSENSNHQPETNQFKQKSSFPSNVDKYTPGKIYKIDDPESQLTNVDSIPTKLSQNDFPKFKYSTVQHKTDLDKTSDPIIPILKSSYSDKYYNQQNNEPYSTEEVPVPSGGISISSQDIYDPFHTKLSSTSMPSVTFVETTPSSTFVYSSSPNSSNDNFNGRYRANDKPQRVQAEDDRNAVILNYENILTPEGFAFSFDTSNGIHADESGTAIDGVRAKGSYSFTGDDGKIYSIEYTADENGFFPHGDHLPTSPPIPNAILKNIELAERNKQIGIIDDGSYDDSKYGHHRYQGVMNRITPNQYNNIILNQPGFKETKQHSNTPTIGNLLPTNGINNGETLDQISVGYEPNIQPNSGESKIGDANQKDLYIDEDDKMPSTLDGANQENEYNYFSSKVENFNKKPSEDNNKFNSRTLAPNNYKNMKTTGPMRYTNNLPEEYNSQKDQNDYQLGYEYKQPKNPLHGHDIKNFEPHFSSIRKSNRLSPTDGTQNKQLRNEDFPSSKVSFNQRPDTSSQISRKILNDPITSADNINNGNTQYSNNDISNPDITSFLNRESSGNKEVEYMQPRNGFKTLDPKYASTTLKPYSIQGSYTSVGNDKQRNNYPSATLGPQYTVSTTPLPSEISSTFTTSVDSFSYPKTTPASSQITSTLRPLVTSGRATVDINSSPIYTGGISELEPVQNSGTSTIRPNSFGQRIFGRPGYQGRTNKIPITGTAFPDTSDFGVSDTRSRNPIVLQPDHIESQTSTEKVIGEDFSGPKQTQRFDPQYGYYY